MCIVFRTLKRAHQKLSWNLSHLLWLATDQVEPITKEVLTMSSFQMFCRVWVASMHAWLTNWLVVACTSYCLHPHACTLTHTYTAPTHACTLMHIHCTKAHMHTHTHMHCTNAHMHTRTYTATHSADMGICLFIDIHGPLAQHQLCHHMYMW